MRFLSNDSKTHDKSDLLVCLEGLAYYLNGISQVDAKIQDGTVVVNMLPTIAVSIFQDYIDDTFIPYVKGQLQSVERITGIVVAYKTQKLIMVAIFWYTLCVNSNI